MDGGGGLDGSHIDGGGVDGGGVVDGGGDLDGGGVDGGDADGGGFALPPLPLHTQSRWVLDASGKRFKLASVNWYGAESPDFVVAGLDILPLSQLAGLIRQLGFNSVRLPFSNELIEKNPQVAASRLSANPPLVGLSALEILDRIIAALAAQGLVVILDDHVSRADWCCSDTDGNGLWYSSTYPESAWLADWRTVAARYRSQPAVVGVELRNELRAANGVTPVWGGGDPARDWRAAAQRAGNAVLAENPALLVVVGGLAYSTDFSGASSQPISLDVADRLVWGPHDYSWFHSGSEDYSSLKTATGNHWGFLLAQGRAYTAPVWVSEFGTCNTADDCVSATSGQGLWFQSFLRVLDDADVDWSCWAFNGTESTGTSRTLGAPETYGVLGPRWDAPALSSLLKALQARQGVRQTP